MGTTYISMNIFKFAAAMAASAAAGATVTAVAATVIGGIVSGKKIDTSKYQKQIKKDQELKKAA